eukprot:scaffold10.g2443.t1
MIADPLLSPLRGSEDDGHFPIASQSPLPLARQQQLQARPAPAGPSNAAEKPPALNRAAAFKCLLDAEVLDSRALRELAFHGVPDDRGLRAAVWRCLLHYQDLIIDPKKFSVPSGVQLAADSHPNPLLLDAATRTSSGASGADGASVAGGGGGKGSGGGGAAAAAAASLEAALHRMQLGHEDHPLSTSEGSMWKAYFADAEMQQQIERDVQRTHPDMHFFGGGSHEAAAHRRQMQRALFVYAKLNPGIRYVQAGAGARGREVRGWGGAAGAHAETLPAHAKPQGMNELLAPLYYLFATDPDKEVGAAVGCRGAWRVQGRGARSIPCALRVCSPAAGGSSEEDVARRQTRARRCGRRAQAAAHAEADAFYCFVDLLSEFRDHFCKQLDNSAVGIKATMAQLSQFLRAYDEQLWMHLEVVNHVNPQFYAFRWITLLLTQEFAFPDALRLWDTLLSDQAGRGDCLLRLCAAMLLHVREELLEGDFAANMKLLQRYPPVDVHVILRQAEALKHVKAVAVLD